MSVADPVILLGDPEMGTGREGGRKRRRLEGRRWDDDATLAVMQSHLERGRRLVRILPGEGLEHWFHDLDLEGFDVPPIAPSSCSSLDMSLSQSFSIAEAKRVFKAETVPDVLLFHSNYKEYLTPSTSRQRYTHSILTRRAENIPPPFPILMSCSRSFAVLTPTAPNGTVRYTLASARPALLGAVPLLQLRRSPLPAREPVRAVQRPRPSRVRHGEHLQGFWQEQERRVEARPRAAAAVYVVTAALFSASSGTSVTGDTPRGWAKRRESEPTRNDALTPYPVAVGMCTSAVSHGAVVSGRARGVEKRADLAIVLRAPVGIERPPFSVVGCTVSLRETRSNKSVRIKLPE
ncbi:hypothetical protein FB451DRAFT_1171659 [Mycena latifolia]|nr:hypothetical protein FB451DRAFT_1171659 [Mycena latifolia]